MVCSILDVGEQEAAARIAFAYLGERFDRLRVDIVHDALGARARRVGIGAERRESAETLEPARLRLELKLSTLGLRPRDIPLVRSEEHTSELQSLMRISYAVFCLKKQNK